MSIEITQSWLAAKLARCDDADASAGIAPAQEAHIEPSRTDS